MNMYVPVKKVNRKCSAVKGAQAFNDMNTARSTLSVVSLMAFSELLTVLTVLTILKKLESFCSYQETFAVM